MKRKNDQMMFNDEGELVEAIRTSFFNQYPVALIIGVISMLIGLIAGLIIQAGFDQYNLDSGMNNTLIGCFISYDTKVPDNSDLLEAYYTSTKFSVHLTNCMYNAGLEAYDVTTKTTLSPVSTNFFFAGCIGSSSITYNQINDKEYKKKYVKCLADNNLRFRYTTQLTPTIDIQSTLPK